MVVCVFAMSKHVCQECGCQCSSCCDDTSLNIHLHKEIELLKYRVSLQSSHIDQMESNMIMSMGDESETASLRNSLFVLQEKYSRLLDSHRKLQKVNQSLEEKLIKFVDSQETEKVALNKEITTLTSKLMDAKVTLCDLEEDNERLRNDCNLAVQMLQCNPSNFVAQKIDSLPSDIQRQIKSHASQEQQERYYRTKPPPSLNDRRATIRIPVATFPPTAMVYSINKPPPHEPAETETVSPSVLAKVLERSQSSSSLSSLKKSQCQWSHFRVQTLETTEQTTQTNDVVNGCEEPCDCRKPRLSTSSHSSMETMIL